MPGRRNGTPLGAGVVVVVPRAALVWIHVLALYETATTVAVVVQADIDRGRCCEKAKENRGEVHFGLAG